MIIAKLLSRSRAARPREELSRKKLSLNGTLQQPQLIADYACEIAENPLWHPIEQRLYWCDIPKGRLFRYDPAIGAHEQCYEVRMIG